MDNNPAENAIRGPVIGRKNYYGSGSLWSAALAATLFTLLQTLALWGIPVRRWLHNGSILTLEQVVEFYFRGGNFNNPHHFATLVFQQDFTNTDKTNLVAFLKALTDERVRWEKAPFDHPQLLVPHGHQATPDPNYPTHAQDLFLNVPAVGKYGRNQALGPIKPFHEYLLP